MLGAQSIASRVYSVRIRDYCEENQRSEEIWCDKCRVNLVRIILHRACVDLLLIEGATMRCGYSKTALQGIKNRAGGLRESSVALERVWGEGSFCKERLNRGK